MYSSDSGALPIYFNAFFPVSDECMVDYMFGLPRVRILFSDKQTVYMTYGYATFGIRV